MKNLDQRNQIIEYSLKLNSTNLSPLRSGNISLRYKSGFLITPSGKEYSLLKVKDIVFVNLNGKYNKNQKPSSEWRFHQDIYISKKNAKAIVHSHSTNATALSTHNKKIIDDLRKSQRPLAYKKKISNYVIKNNFKLQSLKKNIKIIKKKILNATLY